MPSPSILILAVDDEPDLCALTKEFLEMGGEIEVDSACSVSEAKLALAKKNYDAILSDYQMPDEDGIKFLKTLRAVGNRTPFILFTGKGREEVVIEALNNGADAYLQKGTKPVPQYAELEHRIRTLVQHHRAEEALRESERRLQRAEEVAGFGHWQIDLNKKTIEGSQGAMIVCGLHSSSMVYSEWQNIPLPEYRPFLDRSLKEMIEEGKQYDVEAKIRRPIDGEIIDIRSMAKYDREKKMIFGVLQDITKRKWTENALLLTEQKYRSLFENMLNGFAYCRMLFDDLNRPVDFVYLDVNDAFTSLTGLKDVVGKRVTEVIPGVKESTPELFEIYGRVALTGRPEAFEIDLKPLNMTLHISVFSPQKEYFVAIFENITDQKRAEGELTESENKYRALFASESDGIFVIDKATGIIIECNDAVTKMYGYQKDEVIGRSNEKFSYEPEKTKVATGEVQRLIPLRYHKKKDNSVFPVEITANVISLKGREVIIAAVRDISERKQYEGALQEREERYKHISETTTDFVFSCIRPGDGTYSIDWMAGAVERILGYPIEEMIKMGCWRCLVHPDDIQIFDDNITNLPPGKSSACTLRIRTKSGSMRWLSINTTNRPANDISSSIQIFGGCSDITERKRAEEVLLETQEQLRMAMNLAKLVHWEYDIVADLFTFDDQFYSLFGTTAEKEGGTKMASATYAERFLPPEEAYLVGIEVEAAHSTRDPNFSRQFEHDIIRRDGERRTIAVVIRVVMDQTGKPIKTYGANQDITDRKRAEKALLEANRKLNLLSNITRHDINNQLMTLIGNMTLLDTKSLDEYSAQHLMKAEIAAERISSMIQITKEYEDIGVHAPKWQNIHGLLVKAAGGVTLGTVKVVNDVPSDIEIFADPLIQKVFFNLMDNAVRHGQKISIIRFSIQKGNGSNALVCEDDGNGIPSAEKERIFERGYGQNTGLGLFLSREILSITGITIKEEGKSGHGARFVMIIPVNEFRESRISNS